ncbi:type II secretion system F family protein [Halobacterium zhouii]|uniref:type II secretion system F family protein n=1 Tax=Halobacterium zhouii TaxID=2902624 RepID=UPI001E5073CC|nr:type II secretion system F family protein [Halobacterium zhouii]
MALAYLPLVLVFAVVTVVALTPFVDQLDRLLSRVALATFGRFARDRESANPQQVRSLHGAHVGTTYRVYAARTYLYATVAALAGSILGVYLVAGALVFLGTVTPEFAAQLPAPLGPLVAGGRPGFDLLELFGLFLLSSATLGVTSAFATHQVRWLLPKYEAAERARRINASMERTVAFMYALSRSGMALPEVLRILARNREVYGESAREMAVAVKDVDVFGADILRALERLGDRTPSDELAEFTENLTSVLQSGQNLPSFLHNEYEYYAEEAEARQSQFLELLATLAEAYVTVLVAGPLFLITILVVIGLTLGGTLGFLRLTGYLLVPLATAGFVVYLDSITETAIANTTNDDEREASMVRFVDVPTADGVARSDGGATDLGGKSASGVPRETNRERFDTHEWLRPILYRLRHPFAVVLESPSVVFWVTTPLTLGYLVVRWWPLASNGVTDVSAYDDPLVHAALFVLGTFALAYELHRRRLGAIEAGVPDFLDRFASTNEAGMAAVPSFGRVVDSDLGALTRELERTWADIQWGARIENALHRFGQRAQTPAISRVVALTTNAMRASGDLGPVLRIAADEAKATRRLERDRRNELLTYLVVIYVSFFVFLAIIVALDTVFIPNLPSGGLGGAAAGSSVPTGPFSRAAQLTEAKKDAYSLVFFHTGLVQAICSGLVAGQMGENSVKAGAKHATVMLLASYGTFVLIG